VPARSEPACVRESLGLLSGEEPFSKLRVTESVSNPTAVK
jgi:hypothetical protein